MLENEAQECVELLGKMVSLLGYKAEIEAATEEKRIVLHVKSDESARLIGRKGRHLEHLEFLLVRMLWKKGTNLPNIVIDIDGYRGRKKGGSRSEAKSESKDELIAAEKAKEAAKELKRWGEPKVLGPYNTSMRRVVHRTLNDDPDVVTESGEENENGAKEIIVKLKGEGAESAPEEKARTETEGADNAGQ